MGVFQISTKKYINPPPQPPFVSFPPPQQPMSYSKWKLFQIDVNHWDFFSVKISNPSQREGMAWNVLHLLVCKYSAVLSDYQLWMIFHSHPFLKWDLSFVSGPEKGQLWRVLEQSRRTINYVNAHILNGSYFSWPVIKTTLLRM